MSVGAISSNNSLYQNNVQSPSQQERKDFMDLSKSLKAGDLAGAQQAFSSLQQDLQAAGQSQDSSVGSALDNLGKALQSGDLTGAQKAFATLKTDMRNAQGVDSTQSAKGSHKGHHHHHKVADTQSASGSGAVTTMDSQLTGSNINTTV